MAGRRDGAGSRRRTRGAWTPPYPAHWEADIALRDGSAAHLRPIRPEDADALQAFHVSQSEQSIYFRFMAPMPRLSPRDLERFTHVDHRDRVAFVVLQGAAIVAVGRYDRYERDGHEAEVAFNVADRMQGLGIGSILLEHLAAAARELGITTFTAEVLPTNASMLRVFTETGFDVRRTLDDGVLLVAFDIDPTERSRAVIAEREHRAEARAMERLLHPRSLLVVGVSSRIDTAGAHMIRALERSEWQGAVHVVARNVFEYGGHQVHGRISDVPGPVDLAVLAVGPRRVLDAIDECAQIGVRGLLVPTEVYTGDIAEGTALQHAVISRARLHGMRVLGPGSFGFLRTGGPDPISLSLVSRTPRAGTAALASQSSALSALMLAAADARGTGVHEFVSVGTRADVSLNDSLQHWEDDPQVSVIGLGVESMGNPRKFVRLARRLTRKVPIVVVRPPAPGEQRAQSHHDRQITLSGRGLDQLLASAGMVLAESPGQLMDIVDAITRVGLPAGPRVGLLSNSPALADALKGAAAVHGIEDIAEVRTVPLASEQHLLHRAVVSTAARGGVDLLIAAFLDPLDGDLVTLHRQISTVARHSEVPLLLCGVADQPRAAALQSAVREDGTLAPVFREPSEAVRAAAGLLDARASRESGQAEPERMEVDRHGARRLVDAAMHELGMPESLDPRRSEADSRGEALSPDQTRTILACYGLDVLPSQVVSTAQDAERAAAELGYPVALKSTDATLQHRPDLGAVRLDIAGSDHLRRAYAEMRRELSFSEAPFLVQPMARPGVPVVMRSQEDPALGPVVTVSISGDATDLLGDTASAIPPLSRGTAKELLRTPRASVRLEGGGGVPPADLDALAEVLVRLAQLAEDLPQVSSCVLHPVLAGADGVRIITARMVIAPAPNRMDGLRRVLVGSGGL